MFAQDCGELLIERVGINRTDGQIVCPDVRKLPLSLF